MLRDQLAAAIATGSGTLADCVKASVLRRPSGKAPIAVTVIPIRANPGAGRSRARAAVLLQPTGYASTPSTRTLQETFGLTLAESKVVVRLVRGLSLEAIAADMRIALATVRSHLYRAFEKTGATRQAELLSIVTGRKALEPQPARLALSSRPLPDRARTATHRLHPEPVVRQQVG